MSNRNDIITVGTAISKIRKSKGLTLKELSALCGLSTAYISQVERCVAMPSLIALFQLAEALDVPIDKLIKTSKSFKTYRKNNELEEIPVSSDITYYGLSNPFPNQKLDPILLSIPAGYNTKPVKGEGHDGEGFLYVINGKLSITYHGNEFDLDINDSMHYDLKNTLLIANKTDTAVKVLWVGTIII